MDLIMNKIAKTYEDHKPYALVCVYTDDPIFFRVVDYFYAPDPAFDLADELNKSNIPDSKYKVIKFYERN
jgi:hypothetical protein